MPGLGRRYSPDSRDQNYPMRAVLPATTDRTYRYWWMHGQWLDQGATGTCVGHAWAHWLDDGPVRHRKRYNPDFPNEGLADPFDIYLAATLLDVWPENDNGDLNFGTSVRAGAKALQGRGFVSEYRWAWDASQVVQAILTTGPVVVGTNWYSDMFSPDDEGIVHATGSPAGGHAYVLNGVNTKRGLFRLKNSWGREWGRESYRPDNSGYAYISIEDMDRLIDQQGEACLAVEVSPV